MKDVIGELSYRHWFFLSLMVLFNVIIFGCLVLAIFGRISFG